MASETTTDTKAINNTIEPGMTVRVHQILTEKNAKGEEKKRIQIFEGIVLARRHGTEPGATITVRKISDEELLIRQQIETIGVS